MLNKAPEFWWKQPHGTSLCLAPFSWVYGAIAGRRMARAVGVNAGVPVICIGNFTVGGTGKTPVAEALAAAAIVRGKKPGFVLRGFGANVRNAVLVDLLHHTHEDVGDEALMLARTAPTAVSPKRVDAALLLEREGVDFIIMDDGLQSGKLGFDFAVAVVDAKRGFGNGFCLPAGPLRAPLYVQLEKINFVLLNGGGRRGDAVSMVVDAARLPIAHIHSQVSDGVELLAGKRVLAFAGIGDPQKFFDTLVKIGAKVVKCVALADHQVFTPTLALKLLEDAKVQGLTLATTAKDAARLHGSDEPILAKLREKSVVLRIKIVFDDEDIAFRIIDATMNSFNRASGLSGAVL